MPALSFEANALLTVKDLNLKKKHESLGSIVYGKVKSVTRTKAGLVATLQTSDGEYTVKQSTLQAGSINLKPKMEVVLLGRQKQESGEMIFSGFPNDVLLKTNDGNFKVASGKKIQIGEELLEKVTLEKINKTLNVNLKSYAKEDSTVSSPNYKSEQTSRVSSVLNETTSHETNREVASLEDSEAVSETSDVSSNESKTNSTKLILMVILGLGVIFFIRKKFFHVFIVGFFLSIFFSNNSFAKPFNFAQKFVGFEIGGLGSMSKNLSSEEYFIPESKIKTYSFEPDTENRIYGFYGNLFFNTPWFVIGGGYGYSRTPNAVGSAKIPGASSETDTYYDFEKSLNFYSLTGFVQLAFYVEDDFRFGLTTSLSDVRIKGSHTATVVGTNHAGIETFEEKFTGRAFLIEPGLFIEKHLSQMWTINLTPSYRFAANSSLTRRDNVTGFAGLQENGSSILTRDNKNHYINLSGPSVMLSLRAYY